MDFLILVANYSFLYSQFVGHEQISQQIDNYARNSALFYMYMVIKIIIIGCQIDIIISDNLIKFTFTKN